MQSDRCYRFVSLRGPIRRRASDLSPPLVPPAVRASKLRIMALRVVLEDDHAGERIYGVHAYDGAFENARETWECRHSLKPPSSGKFILNDLL
jgi:hypothetical protein